MSNVGVTEAELVAKAIGPRVTKEEMEANIADKAFYYHGLLTICVITLRNGFIVVGESACAWPANYDKDIGERLSFSDAQGKIWPLMGYELKSKVALVYGSNPKSIPEQKTYIGTKVIHALPMSRQDYNDLRGWELPADENGADEGYLVEYGDGDAEGTRRNHHQFRGYISWSPKAVFEAAYEPIDIINYPTQLQSLQEPDSWMLAQCEESTDAADVTTGTSAASEGTWQERLRTEYDELSDRLNKLEDFISHNPLFKSLSDRQQRLQIDQREAMQTLFSILEARLHDHGLLLDQ
jgi:hypothetical protein